MSNDFQRTMLAPAGTRLYAVGDIHGRRDLLDRLLALILEDARKSRAGRRVVVFLGDYVDRGPDAAQVVERLAAGPPATPHWAGFRWICLKGNHEDAMLRFLDDVEAGPVWLANGGAATVRSYVRRYCSDAAEAAIAAEATEEAFGKLDLHALQALIRRHLPADHRTFLEALPVSHVEGDYLFVHAGVRPGVPLAEQDPTDLLWIRSDFLASPADHGKVVVHGHTITRTPDVRKNRIGLDTGAFYTGHLSALVAEGANRSFLGT